MSLADILTNDFFSNYIKQGMRFPLYSSGFLLTMRQVTF